MSNEKTDMRLRGCSNLVQAFEIYARNDLNQLNDWRKKFQAPNIYQAVFTFI
jgi:hypothetical protein